MAQREECRGGGLTNVGVEALDCKALLDELDARHELFPLDAILVEVVGDSAAGGGEPVSVRSPA